MMQDLEKLLTNHINENFLTIKPRSIFLYGSFSKDNINPLYSDIDLLIIVHSKDDIGNIDFTENIRTIIYLLESFTNHKCSFHILTIEELFKVFSPAYILNFTFNGTGIYGESILPELNGFMKNLSQYQIFNSILSVWYLREQYIRKKIISLSKDNEEKVKYFLSKQVSLIVRDLHYFQTLQYEVDFRGFYNSALLKNYFDDLEIELIIRSLDLKLNKPEALPIDVHSMYDFVAEKLERLKELYISLTGDTAITIKNF